MHPEDPDVQCWEWDVNRHDATYRKSTRDGIEANVNLVYKVGRIADAHERAS